MSYRTAAILSVVLVGGMFAVSFATMAAAGRVMEHGVEIPGYERAFLGFGFFVAQFKWVLAMPIFAVLFLLAACTSKSRVRK